MAMLLQGKGSGIHFVQQGGHFIQTIISNERQIKETV
jgi:hypothetical protein